MRKRKKKNKSAKVVASNKRSDNMNLRVILISLVTITLLIFYIIVKNNIGTISMPSFQQHADTQLFGTPTTAPTKTTELVRKNPDGTTTTIVKSQKDTLNPTIFQWKNYIFVASDLVLKAYNLDTGESKELFRSTDQEIIRGSFGPVAIIGNRLYFTYTAYRSKNPVYFIDLPPTGSAITLNSEFNGVNDFIKAGSYYYVVKAFGDGCGGVDEYSVFDPKNNYIMKPWLTSNGGCVFKEQLIGFEVNGNMIFSYREEDPVEKQQNFIGRYTNITRIYPWTPDQKEVLLDTASMPKNVKYVYYSQTTNSIVMIGDSVSILNLITRAMNIIAETPKDWNYNTSWEIKGYDGANLCIKKNDSDSTLWNISGNSISDTKKPCEGEKDVLGTSLDITHQSFDEQLSALKLPPNYEVIHR